MMNGLEKLIRGRSPGNDVSPRRAKAGTGARLYSPADRLRLYVQIEKNYL